MNKNCKRYYDNEVDKLYDNDKRRLILRPRLPYEDYKKRVDYLDEDLMSNEKYDDLSTEEYLNLEVIKPKKLSPYVYFSMCKRESIKREYNYKLSFAELGKKLGEMWNNLPN
jgi:hypothetical protein